jgi:class 3 adenylate cyclase
MTAIEHVFSSVNEEASLTKLLTLTNLNSCNRRLSLPGQIHVPYKGRRRNSLQISEKSHDDSSNACRFQCNTINAVILFCSIRNFNASFHTNETNNEAAIEFLQRYAANLSSIVKSCNGCINNYINDKILIIFKIKNREIQACCEQALKCGIWLEKEFKALKDSEREEYNKDIRLDIGIDCGEVAYGKLGYYMAPVNTVIGTPVNKACRLCFLSKELNKTEPCLHFCLSDNFIKNLPEQIQLGDSLVDKLQLIESSFHRLKGFSDPCLVHQCSNEFCKISQNNINWKSNYNSDEDCYSCSRSSSLTNLPNVIDEEPISTRQMAVLFCDIRNFTELCANTQYPKKVMNLLNAFFAELGHSVISGRNGEIVNYIGDCLFAVFPANTNEPQSACQNAYESAHEIINLVSKISPTIFGITQSKIFCGVSLAFGTVTYSKMGNCNDLESTACIGRPVILAETIDALSKTYENQAILGLPNNHSASTIIMENKFYNNLPEQFRAELKSLDNQSIDKDVNCYGFAML